MQNASKVHGQLRAMNEHKLQFIIQDNGEGIDSGCEIKEVFHNMITTLFKWNIRS